MLQATKYLTVLLIILSTKEARANYYGTQDSDSMEQLKHQYEIIYESLSKPIVRMESACFMWLVKNDREA